MSRHWRIFGMQLVSFLLLLFGVLGAPHHFPWVIGEYGGTALVFILLLIQLKRAASSKES